MAIDASVICAMRMISRRVDVYVSKARPSRDSIVQQHLQIINVHRHRDVLSS